MVGAEEMTIDMLARRAGMTTRSVRSYRTLGLLPPPRLMGRVGRYDIRHLDRLRSVRALLERGFPLALIRDVLAALDYDRTVRELLGFEKTALTGSSSKVREVTEHGPVSK